MTSKSVKETARVAARFAKGLKVRKEGATVVALSGDLGSGKTTFTKAFAKGLGVNPNEITSPTFVIMKKYDLPPRFFLFKKFLHLIHIDAYRLEKAEEIEKLGWREMIADPKNLILIEWPENVGGALPADAQKISFKFVDETTREIDFQ